MHDYADYIDGSSVAPADPVTWTDVARALRATKAAVEVEWRKELKTWKQGEAIVKQQIAATISDSRFIKICRKATAREIWEAPVGGFEKRS